MSQGLPWQITFIRTLPNGYDTMLNRGGDDLSQGQRQLITMLGPS